MKETIQYNEEDYKNIILPVAQEIWHPEDIPISLRFAEHSLLLLRN